MVSYIETHDVLKGHVSVPTRLMVTVHSEKGPLTPPNFPQEGSRLRKLLSYEHGPVLIEKEKSQSTASRVQRTKPKAQRTQMELRGSGMRKPP